MVFCKSSLKAEMNPIEVITICDRCGVEDCVHMGNNNYWENEAVESECELPDAHLSQIDDGEEVQQNLDVSQSQTFEELLIANVQAKPALWNSKLKISQRGKTEKDKLWLEIADFFANRYTVAYLQKKWRNLRDQFVKAKGEMEAYVPSGSGAEPRKKVWKHFESMKFLMDTMTPRATISNIVSPRCSSPAPSPLVTTPEISQAQTPRGTKRARETDNSFEIIEAIKNLPPPPSINIQQPAPPINPICLRLSDMMNQLNSEDRLDLEIQFLLFTKNFIYKKK